MFFDYDIIKFDYEAFSNYDTTKVDHERSFDNNIVKFIRNILPMTIPSYMLYNIELKYKRIKLNKSSREESLNDDVTIVNLKITIKQRRQPYNK